MARRQSIIGALISFVVGIILLVAIIAVSLFAFVKIKFDVNLLDVISQVKTLTEEVNASETYTKMFANEDLESVKISLNTSFNSDVVTNTEADGYKISEDITSNLTGTLQLTDKQVASLISMVLKNQDEVASVKIGETNLNIELVQVEFSNLVENYSVDYNVVVKVSLKSLKDNMKGFPFNLIKNYIPEDVYISSTVNIKKGTEPFAYTYESKSLEINNLKTEDVNSLLTTVNKFVDFGDAAKLNNMIAGSFADAMLGNEEVNGFVYSLKDAGATDFNFVTASEQIVLQVSI